MKILHRIVIAFLLLSAASGASAMDFVSVADATAIMYDAPSTKSNKLFVISRFMPLEQVVALESWVKVRDSAGTLGWIEKRAISNKRYVMVTDDLAELRRTPEETAQALLRVKRNVALELIERTGDGWVKVRHASGIEGYVQTSKIWGI
jgi:SH3-like domain-containing protein